ncbi:hypothetical protein [Roseibium suaedae]|uniref:Uncharacterized protein n=1 Tax=Roseibium suaedae TaxID=735517 RepID=A0A1M7GRS8_9HYPH|nr:hypothetical protein [Roseibium suaedae]SHM18858.1 hypothetical protein SAMN05444272_1999 [Roseibium suaedae]
MTQSQTTLTEFNQIETSAKQRIDLLNAELAVLNGILKLQRLSAGAKAATSPGIDTIEELKTLLASLKS